MDGVRFNGIYRVIPRFSHNQVAPDDPVTAITQLLNSWVDGQNIKLKAKEDQFSRRDKRAGRKINPIESRAIEALDANNYNRAVFWITNDRNGRDLDEYNRRIAPIARYSSQTHNYNYSDLQEMSAVNQDFAARAVNLGVFFKKTWFKDASRLQVSVQENETSLSRPSAMPSQAVFRQPSAWERFWMHWRQP